MLRRLMVRPYNALRLRSIRARLVLAFGALLALAALNVLIFYRGSMQRQNVFEELRRAIERQTIILEAAHELENQYRQVKLLTEVVGVSGSPPSEAERESFARRVDSIPIQLTRLLELSERGRLADIRELRGKSEQLAGSWKKFYESRGVDPVRAIQEVVLTAEPLAAQLLTSDFPAAVQREKRQLDQASAAFVRADRASSRVTWSIFVLSALLGSFLAITTSRSLLRAIATLKVGAEKIGRGELQHRIRVENRDELAEVARSFNIMANRLRQRTLEIEEQRRISDSLLLNILPRRIANELRESGRVEAKYFADTTIMFADLVAFTKLFDQLSVDRMVRLLDQLFTDFDRIIRGYRLEKLKTIGDAYLCAGGLSEESSSHPVDAVMAAFDIVDAVRRRGEMEGLPLAVRIGIHTGPVAAGVVGIEKFAFDVWGDTVNFAARLEATSTPDRINISNSTYLRVKDFFACEQRGQVKTKEQRTFDMYFVSGLHPELAGTGAPPPAFQQRYQIYFSRSPVNFPRSLVLA